MSSRSSVNVTVVPSDGQQDPSLVIMSPMSAPEHLPDFHTRGVISGSDTMAQPIRSSGRDPAFSASISMSSMTPHEHRFRANSVEDMIGVAL